MDSLEKKKNFAKMSKKQLIEYLEHLIQYAHRKPSSVKGSGLYGSLSSRLGSLQSGKSHLDKLAEREKKIQSRALAKQSTQGSGIGQYFGVLGNIGDALFDNDEEEDEEEEHRRQLEEERLAMIKAREDAIQQEKDTQDALYNLNRRRNILGDFMNDMKERGYIKEQPKVFNAQEARNNTDAQRKARLERERQEYIGGSNTTKKITNKKGLKK